MMFYAIRFNSAVTRLGIHPLSFDRSLRLALIELGRRKNVPPKDMAVLAIAELPMVSRLDLDRGRLGQWVKEKQINVDRTEMKVALTTLGCLERL